MNIMNKWVNIMEKSNLQSEQIIQLCEQISYTKTNNINSGINIYTLRRKEFTDVKFMYMTQEKNET